MLIELRDVTKTFKEKNVLDRISLQVNNGEILGLLGPNGSGKSTTMKIIAGYLKPTKGSIFVCGYDNSLFADETKPFIGYLPENNPLYPNMYVYEYLQFIGGLYGLDRHTINTRLTYLVKKLKIQSIESRKLENLSKGYKQRVGLAQVLLHNPRVLILDEPATGLDPNQLIELRTLIKEISKEKAVILSSHIMSEIEYMCDRVVIIDQGKKILDSPIDLLKEQRDIKLMIELKERELVPEKFLEISGVKKAYRIKNKFILKIDYNTFNKGKDIRESVFAFIKTKGFTLLEMSIVKNSIEHIFSKLTK